MKSKHCNTSDPYQQMLRAWRKGHPARRPIIAIHSKNQTEGRAEYLQPIRRMIEVSSVELLNDELLKGGIVVAVLLKHLKQPFLTYLVGHRGQ